MNKIMIKVYKREDYGTFDEHKPVCIFLCSCFYVNRGENDWYDTLYVTVNTGDLHFFDYPLIDVCYEVYTI